MATARTDSSCAERVNAFFSSPIDSGSSALRFSGRFSVIRAMPDSALNRINVDLHAQQCGRVCFSLRIGLKCERPTTIQAFMEEKVQCSKIRQFKALYFAQTDSLEMFFDARRSHFPE